MGSTVPGIPGACSLIPNSLIFFSLAACAISRMVPGVLGNQESGSFESFEGNLLEYPQYSRPEEWNGRKVPPILLSGHHKNIEAWRRQQSILLTQQRRPDLLEQADLTEEEWDWLKGIGGS